MTKYDITAYHEPDEVHFSIRTAARIARVTESFILTCEHEELVTTRQMHGGEIGLCCSDIRRLKLVRHLHEDLGFKLENIEFVLSLRERLHELYDREKQMVDAHHRRERELIAEIEALRRQFSPAE